MVDFSTPTSGAGFDRESFFPRENGDSRGVSGAR